VEKPIRALVLAADYSNPDGKIKLHYIHMRNINYVQQGIDVTVVNFRAKDAYTLDGIPVITLKDYAKNSFAEYDLLICHAPNIRNHYLFLKRYHHRFAKLVFVFHGHEVLKLKTVYPKPFPFMKRSPALSLAARDIYDGFKLRLWKGYLPRLSQKSRFVFVSDWMQREFFRFTGIPMDDLKGHCEIIGNAVGSIFEVRSYDAEVEKKYDFFALRSDMDLPKYGVDIVNNLAFSNPQLEFLLVGRGTFFSHIDKAANLTWIQGAFPHDKIVDMLDQCRCGLLPTRLDAQGLMACEFAAYGIPLITSDIDVCREVFDGMDNVAFINNEDVSLDLKPILNRLTAGVPYKKDRRYFAENTVQKEIDLIKEICHAGA
jgi:glycosyltransferase involved in cell wall biosynthesis